MSDRTDHHDPIGPGAEEPANHLSQWVELFYDLVFVAAILIFTKGVEHVHPQSGAFWIVGVFAASWWIWYSSTLLMRRFHQADVVHRLLLLVQMLLIVLMAMEARVSVHNDATLLAVEFGLLLSTVAAMFARAARAGGPYAGAARRLAACNAVAAAVFFLGSAIPLPARIAVNTFGLVIVTVGSIVIWRSLVPFTDDDEDHFIERMAAFTLIVCGEAFIENALAVSGATISSIDIGSLVFEFVLVFAVFTSYFEDVPSGGINPRRFGLWSGLHLVIAICIGATAVSATKLIDVDGSHHVPDSEILRLTVPLFVFYLTLAGIDACTRRRPLGPMRSVHLVTSGAVLVVGAVAWYTPAIHLAEALPMIDVVAVGHLIAVARVRPRTTVVDRHELERGEGTAPAATAGA
jgi:low temperature requirement protein LtrA